MRKLILAVGVIVFSFSGFSQDYLGDQKSKIIGLISKEKNVNYSLVLSDTNNNEGVRDHLGIMLNGPTKLEIDCYFNLSYHLCDSVVVRYHCSNCAESAVKGAISEKHRKWKMVDSSRYVSRSWYDKERRQEGTFMNSPNLQIIKTPGEPVCTTILLWVSRLIPRKEWKKLTGM